MNVLVINGHPRGGSFSEALVNSFVKGALNAGVCVTELHLGQMAFNPNVIMPSPRNQVLENDISHAQQLIAAADHLVFIYPTWWGTMPAILKGFIDRVFTPGFAFEDIEGGTGYQPLLKGRSAQIITTMDTPVWVYRLIYRSPGHNAMKRATLQFCGISPIKTLILRSVKDSTADQRNNWLLRVANEGFKLRHGAISNFAKSKQKVFTWLQAIRLQFYPMSWVAYTCGAFAAERLGYGYDRSVLWIGYLWLFLLEVATVLSNDFYDYKTDKQNKYFGPFTGGSRVLVEGLLTFRQIKMGITSVIAFSFAALVLLFLQMPGSILQAGILCLCLFVLALGYTVPPLRLSYRGLGELTVGVTHSTAVILCGYVFQGGNITDSFPWLLSVPLFFSVLPSIILAGIPDLPADKEAGKKTISVRSGKKMAASLALFFTIIAAAIVISFKALNVLPNAYGYAIYLVVPHAFLLCYLLSKYINNPNPSPRIDTLLVAALTYLVWFGLVPLTSLNS